MTLASLGAQLAEQVLRSAPVIVLVLRPDGCVEHVNPFFERLAGWRLEELRGRDWCDAVLPERDRARIKALLQRAVDGTPTQGNINAIVTRDGRERDIEWHDVLLHGAQGERIGVLAIGRDVTERVQAEAALRRSEERFRRFFESGIVGMAITVQSKHWGRFNQRLCDMLGYSVDELRGLTWAELTHPDDLAADVAQFDRVLSGASDGYALDKRFIRKDGRIVHAAIAVRCERDEAGQVREFFAIVEDISARKQAEDALRISHAALDSSLSGIALADLSGRLDYVNPAFCRLWRISAEQAIGSLAQTYWGAAQDAQVVIDAITTQGAWSGEMLARRHDGSTFDAQVSASMVLGPTGQPLRMMGSFIDVTERKRAERELARHRDELESLVAERTRELVAARDEAERANRAKSEFLSRMSHELRTPMNAVLGFGQLMQAESGLDPRHQRWIDEIVRAGSHLLGLISEVLDLSHIESGRVALSLEAIELAELVDESVHMVEPLAALRAIRVSVEPMPGAVVLADRTRLRQVLLNLLSNAVKYNRDGGSVRIGTAIDNSESVRLEVADSGAGIPRERWGELFQPFRRLGAEFGKVEGTGIGLSIARKLVEMMGGAIGFDSEPGVGSQFWVTLPRGRLGAAAPPRDPPSAPAQPGAGPATPAPAALPAQPVLDVLYVEDNPVNLILVEQIVARHAGLRMLAATSARQGFELAIARRPALLLLDIQLPDADGYTLLAQLRAHPATRDIPAVAVTANAMPDDQRRLSTAGFAECATKPIDLARFDAMLARYLPLA